MTGLQSPTVFVVDDDDAVRRFIKELLASVNLDSETYQSANEFLRYIQPDRPGCLLLDIRMPGMSGLELQQELKSRRIELPTIILTGHGDLQVAVRAMRMGAIDFIEKPFNNELLLERVQSAVASSMREHEKSRGRAEIESRFRSLTRRERQVLALVADGGKNRDIAVQLGISEKTVELHRANMMEKMNAESLVELIRMVMTAQIKDPNAI